MDNEILYEYHSSKFEYDNLKILEMRGVIGFESGEFQEGQPESSRPLPISMGKG